MDKVGNHIKVLLTKHNKDVKVDDIGGELILYDNSYVLDGSDSTERFLLKDYVFSGIALSGLSDLVTLRLEDFYGEELKYTLHKNYLYVKKTMSLDTTDPIAVVRFLPRAPFWAGNHFYAHFIELND